MGKGFGNLAYVRHQITFTLSPFEQKPFANVFKTGLPNTLRRMVEEAPLFLPPVIAMVAFMNWTVGLSHKMHTKAYHLESGTKH